MIHVHGGDALLGTLQRAAAPGRFLAYREVLCQGPTPRTASRAEWCSIRGRYLDGEYGPGAERDSATALAEQDQEFDAALEDDEVVLWFGPELFCQAILIRLLARVGETGSVERVSLISVGSYPGVDDRAGCTLGFLNGAQLLQLLARREPVSAAQLEVAREAWEALTAPEPAGLLSFVAGAGHSALPFADAALGRLLDEYPDGGNGLARSEALLLRALEAGESGWIELLEKAQEGEARRWITDTMLWNMIRRLAAEDWPAIEMVGSIPRSGDPDLISKLGSLRFHLTQRGRQVVLGKDNWLRHHPIDRWVGGVHLTPDSLWVRNGKDLVPGS